MLLLLTVLFVIAWVLVGFTLLRAIARRYFHEPRRAATFAAAVVLAFIAGTAWPFSILRPPASAPAPAPMVAAPAVPAVAIPSHDVGSICKSAHFSGAQGLGSVDLIGELQQGQPQQRPAGFVADRTATLAVVGWVADPGAKAAARAACLVIDDKIETRANSMYGVSRPDVGAAYHTDALVPTGYTLTLPVRDLSPGTHRVTVAVVSTTGDTVPLASKATFRVP